MYTYKSIYIYLYSYIFSFLCCVHVLVYCLNSGPKYPKAPKESSSLQTYSALAPSYNYFPCTNWVNHAANPSAQSLKGWGKDRTNPPSPGSVCEGEGTGWGHLGNRSSASKYFPYNPCQYLKFHHEETAAFSMSLFVHKLPNRNSF